MNDNQPQSEGIDFLLVGVNQETLDRDVSVLQQAGHADIRTVHSGVEARNVLKRGQVHFVITEMNLPAMNGLELLRLIRRTPGLSDLPVLMTSDSRNKEVVLYAVDEMVDGYLATPYTGDDLLKAIHGIVARRKNASLHQQMLRKARRLVLAKNYDKAITISKEVLARDVNNSDALFVLSEAYFHLHQPDRSRQFLEMYLGKQPSSSKGTHLLSKVCRLDGSHGDAFTLLLKAHKENPLNIDLAIALGKFYLDMEMEENAQQIFNQILASEPTDLNLIKIGKAFLKKNRVTDAALYLQKTVDPLPETAFVFAQFAEMLQKNGNLAESAVQYEKCLQLVPDHPEYLFRLGELYLTLGELDKARLLCLEWLKRQPEAEEAKKLFALAFHGQQ